MTIWEIEPPQGFTDEQQLTIIGRPFNVRFDSPQSSDQSGTALLDMIYNNTSETMIYNNTSEIMEFN